MTLLNPFSIRQELVDREMTIFTPHEFSKVFNLSERKTKYFLESYTGKLFSRLKKGLYALVTNLPSEEVIANKLYRPSYISFEYALARYGIIPEMPYAVTSATTKPTREFVIDNKTYLYFLIKRQAYTGYTFVREGRKEFFLAEPEKAFVDYLYFVSLGKKNYNDRFFTGQLDKQKVYKYAKLYGRKGLIKLLKNSI